MGLFGENRIEVLGRKISELDSRELNNHNDNHGEIIKVRMDIEEKFNDYDSKISALNEIIQKLLEERAEYRLEKDNNSKKTISENMSVNELCRNVKIPNFNSTTLKFFLFELGLFDMKINKKRNGYTVKSNISSMDSDVSKLIDYENGIISFKPSFVEYLNLHKSDFAESASHYFAKNVQYEESRKNLESKNVKNYQQEIGRICGIGTDFDSSKWGGIYNIFREKYQNFETDFEKYKEDNVNNPKYSKYPISKIGYVVSVMREGNYLLKIACDLYV